MKYKRKQFFPCQGDKSPALPICWIFSSISSSSLSSCIWIFNVSIKVVINYARTICRYVGVCTPFSPSSNRFMLTLFFLFVTTYLLAFYISNNFINSLYFSSLIRLTLSLNIILFGYHSVRLWECAFHPLLGGNISTLTVP